MRWTVGPALVECSGVGRMWCLQVRHAPDGPWMRHYGGIEGFEFRPGVETDVDVRQVAVPRPPADGASRRTVLVAEIARRPVPAGPMPPRLAGTAWRLAAMPGAGPVGDARTPPTLRFDDANGASGDGGVNRWSARVEAGEGWLRIASPRVTRMAGPPEAMALEAAFLARLRGAGVWHVSGDRLWLVDAGGRELAAFARVPAGR